MIYIILMVVSYDILILNFKNNLCHININWGGGVGEAASDHDAARKKEEYVGGASFLETHVSEWSGPTALQNKPPTMEEKEMLQPS